jgi:hypothetical protein
MEVVLTNRISDLLAAKDRFLLTFSLRLLRHARSYSHGEQSDDAH